MDHDEWQPPVRSAMPVGPESFPRHGVNSLATLGSRGAARLIDSLVLGLPYLVAASAVLLVVSGGDPDPDEMSLSSAQSQVLLWAPAIVLAFVYESVCITLWGQTLGKLLTGVRVARVVNGRCPLWWEAALRIAVPGVVAVVPHPLAQVVAVCLFLTAGFDPLRRNVPDRAAGTVVVRAR